MAPRTAKRRPNRTQMLLTELKKWAANDIREHEEKLAEAKAAKAILDAAKDDSEFKYEFIFCQVVSYCTSDGKVPAPETELEGSGRFRHALKDARKRYMEMHGLRKVQAETIVWVVFPSGYKAMLLQSFRKELMAKGA